MHEGHRKRMRERFLRDGLDRFHPHEILEMLLHGAIPRGNTNETAHRLLDRFGTFAAVLDAPYEDLLKVEGVGEVSAAFLKMIPQICRFYFQSATAPGTVLRNTKETAAYLGPRFMARQTETVVLLLLDSRNRAVFCDVVAEGAATMTPVPVRVIVSQAIRYNAVTAILAHNHPSGAVNPSDGDLQVTREVWRALNSVDVLLQDHLIFSNGKYLSFCEAGLMQSLFPSFYSQPEEGNSP